MDSNSGIDEEYDDGKIYDFTKKTWRDDVTFLVGDQRFYANKTVLAIESPVFEAMFGTNFKEREQEEIPLPGKKTEDFHEFLQCIYPKSQKKIDAHNVHKVLPLADEYDVKSLVRKCQRYLSSQLMNKRTSTEGVVFCHILATRYKLQELRDICATRLSDIGLKDIQYRGSTDTEELLELHKDILMRQGELLERTRTELVDMYMNKNLFQESMPARDLTNIMGAIIQFKPCLNLSKEDQKVSNPVPLWNITFEVFLKISKRGNVDYLTFGLVSSFPETNKPLACVVDVKIQVRYGRKDRFRQHICESVKEREFSKHNFKHACGFRKKLSDLIADGFIVDREIDVVAYFMVKKPFVKAQ